MFLFDIKIIFDPIHAPLPEADKQQFINDWPAGYGINEVVDFLFDASRDTKIVMGTEGTFGLFPMALQIYHKDNPNITINSYWPVDNVPPELLESAKEKPTFLVFKEKQKIPTDWPLELIAEYRRGDGPTFLRFYRVLPKT
jgi:hypothetical protein